ncbi:hypothetical protein QTP88_025923 [Uroleucon formosanum]
MGIIRLNLLNAKASVFFNIGLVPFFLFFPQVCNLIVYNMILVQFQYAKGSKRRKQTQDLNNRPQGMMTNLFGWWVRLGCCCGVWILFYSIIIMETGHRDIQVFLTFDLE